MQEDENLNKPVVQWALQSLSSLGFALKSDLPETVINTPWSYVARFETSNGYIYLKHTPELIALEANIIQVLRDQFHVSVAEVIAHNATLNCFLMKDAGRPLREILKKTFNAPLFCKAIEQFTAMQLTVADHVNVFLDMDVPDWRLDKLPDLYMQLLSHKDVLLADGLTEKEISQLEALQPKVYSLCQQLSDYNIKQSIVQPDFQDNNTLIADTTQAITMIDLGEIAISHPFFSLVGCLYQAKKHHGLTDKDDTYLKLQDACLKHYMIFGSKKDLLNALDIARRLWFIYAALADYRLKIACDQAQFTASFQRHGRVSVPLKAFMTA